MRKGSGTVRYVGNATWIHNYNYVSAHAGTYKFQEFQRNIYCKINILNEINVITYEKNVQNIFESSKELFYDIIEVMEAQK